MIQLGAKIGDKIKVISSENKDIEFTITGAFQSGFYDYDSAMIILPLRAVQIMSDSEDIVTEINVNINIYYDKMWKYENLTKMIRWWNRWKFSTSWYNGTYVIVWKEESLWQQQF